MVILQMVLSAVGIGIGIGIERLEVVVFGGGAPSVLLHVDI
jgi:hypothetical protein